MANPWKPGQSGNPNGRPPKGRTWTDLIDKAGRKAIVLPDGSRISAKRFAAQRLVELLTYGKTQLADGATTIEVNGDGWFDIYKWTVVQNDGPAQASIDVTSQGEKVQTLPDGQLLSELAGLLNTARARADAQPGATGALPLDAESEAESTPTAG